MKLSTILIGVVLFSFVSWGFGSMYLVMQSTYNINGSDLTRYYRNETLSSLSDDFGSSVKDGSTITTSDVPYIDTMISTTKTYADLPSLINSIINDIQQDISVDAMVWATIIIIVSVVVGAAVFTVIWRYEI